MTEGHKEPSWEEARLLVFDKFAGIKEGLDEIKKAMNDGFSSFKDEIVKAHNVKFAEMQEEIDILKQNQFALLKKESEDDGKLKGKTAILTVLGVIVSLLLSAGNMIQELLK